MPRKLCASVRWKDGVPRGPGTGKMVCLGNFVPQ